MKIGAFLASAFLLLPVVTPAQQANVNLDYNPQKNTENLIPFSAALRSFFRHLLRNDLERPAIAVAPEVGAVLDTLADEPETLLARVSGSGGTCFALCRNDYDAEGLAERIEALAPAWWVQRCRLGGPWPDPD